MNYVIIGNSAAAIGAVEGIRQVDRSGPITIVSDEPYHTYSRPLISYWLAGKVTEDKMAYRAPGFYEANGVKPILGVRAAKLDPVNRQVLLADGSVVPYDKLLIATGGKPIVPPIEGLNKKGVHAFLRFDHVREIAAAVSAGAKKAVVIGAGLIGLKAAEALIRLGIDVTVVELANRVLPTILDEQAAAMVRQYLEQQGIKFKLNTTVEQIKGEAVVTGVGLRNGTGLSCDMLVVAIGVQPDAGLAREAGITVNRGIVVNEKMETDAAGVYAAGDVAEGYDMVSGTNRVLPLLPNAYRQGEVAGRNMAGAETSFDGGLAMNAIGFGDLPMLTAGIVNPDANEYEVLAEVNPEALTYRKIVLKDNRVVGYILLNRVDRAGILTGLIRGKVDVSAFKERLLSPDFGYADFPAEERKARLSGGVA